MYREAGKRKQLGSLLRFDGGTAEIPSALRVQADFQTEPRRLVESVAIEFAPARAAERGTGGHHAVALLLAAVGVHQERAAVAFGAHLFQVARDGSPVGICL